MKYRKWIAFVMTACILMGSSSHISFAETEADSAQADVSVSVEAASNEPEEKKAEEKTAAAKPAEENNSGDTQEKKTEKTEEEKAPAENKDVPQKSEDVNIAEPAPEKVTVPEEKVPSPEESKESVSEDVSDVADNEEESDAGAADKESVEGPAEDTERDEVDSEETETFVENKIESEKPDTSEDSETENSENTGESAESTSDVQKEESADEDHKNDSGNKEAENVPDAPSVKEDSEDAEEDDADALSVKASADRKYAFVNSDTAKFTAEVSGGKAPYTVEFQAEGASEKSKTYMLEQPEKCVFKCKPDKFGTLTVKVKVTDAEGNSSVSKIEVEAPVLIKDKIEKWEAEFEEIELTGNWNQDLVSIAVTQIGYEESSRNFIITDDGKKMGYTRYGDWFGRDYNDWCGLFVCFCMHYAGIPEEEYPRDSISHNWKNAVEKAGAFERPEEYTPLSGDIVFFNTDDDSRIDHMGIVEFADEEEIHTIEGNSGKKVVRKCYASDDVSIVGYANTGKMMEDAGTDAADSGKKSVRKHTEYEGFTTGTMINIRQTPDADGSWLACIPEKDTRVTVLAAEFSGTQLWYRVRYEDIEGYILSTLLKVDGHTELINDGEN